MLKRNLLLATLLGLTFSSVCFSADVAKLAESCTGCHGKDGASTEADIPSIGGMSAKYLNITFKSYKEKERPF